MFLSGVLKIEIFSGFHKYLCDRFSLSPCFRSCCYKIFTHIIQKLLASDKDGIGSGVRNFSNGDHFSN